MDVTVDRGPLAEALQVCTRLITTRPSRVSGGVLLVARKGGELEILATDLTTVFSTRLAGEVKREGRQVISAKWLQDVVKVLSGECVEIREKAGESALEVVAGPSRFVLRAIPVDAFPEVNTDLEGDLTRGAVPKCDFDKAVSAVVVAAAVDEARPVFTGCLVDVGDHGMKVVATDSYRLAERLVQVDIEGRPRKVVVAGRVLDEVSRFRTDDKDEAVGITLGDDSAAIDVGKNRLRSRYIEGTFPDYEKLIPTKNPNCCLAPRRDLIEAIRRVSVLARDATPVKLVLAGSGVVLEVRDNEVGEAIEEVEGASYSGDDLEVAFNPKYLLDALGGCEGEKVRLEIKDPLSAVLVKSEENDNYRHLIMPIRL